ncbi:MAG: tyrosine-type recombinase/integrase [Solirubrobacteraceae bacterium]
MKFQDSIESYIADMRSQGRLNSSSSVRGYRSTLDAHASDIGNRDPAKVGREDIKRTLRRWPNPNTQGTNRAKLVSFYDWAMEEGIRRDNPARQTRRPRRRRAESYRLTGREAIALLRAARGVRERRAIHLLVCAGLRNAELRGLQGRHLQRAGMVHVSVDIAKGGRERWIPVIADLAAVADEIRGNVAADEYVLPAQRFRNPPFNTERVDYARSPSSSQALRQLVMRVAARAGIAEHVHPHDLRHAFAEQIARDTDARTAQHMLGHAHLGTTDMYLGRPRLDDIVAAVKNVSYETRTNVLGVSKSLQKALEATTGIEPV